MLGYRLKSVPEIQVPTVICFSSTFCSKCLHNKKLLREYLADNQVLDVDISKSSSMLLEVKPLTVPTTIIVDQNGLILFYFEGSLSRDQVETMAKLL